MIKLLVIVATFSVGMFVSPPADAQRSGPRLICEDCRNPTRFPRDYANFAYNQVFGPNSWMDADQADVFTVANLRGHSVFVDMNLGLGTIDIPLPGVVLTVPYPTDLIVQIILHLEDGETLEYKLYPSKRNPNRELPVGKRPRSGGGGVGGGGSGGRSGPPSNPAPSPDPSPGRCGVTDVDGGNKRRTCQ